MIGGFFLLGLSLLGTVINTVLGFELAGSSRMPPETHLIVGFTSSALYIVAFIVLLMASKQRLETKALLAETHASDTIERMSRARESCLLPSFVTLGLFIVGLITGTLSDGGTFPLVHGAVGLGTLGLSAYLLWVWAAFYRKG